MTSRRALPALAPYAVVWALCGCGGASPAAAPPPTAAPAHQPAPTAPAPANAAAPPDDAAPLNDSECAQLTDHLVELSRAEAPKPRGDGYTDADADAAKRELRQAMRPACAQLSRRQLTCALAAKTTAAVRACE